VFAEDIIPVTVRSRRGEEIIELDELRRADVSLEKLAALKSLLGDEDPQATVTAGNASGQPAAAALCVVASRGGRATGPHTSREADQLVSGWRAA